MNEEIHFLRVKSLSMKTTRSSNHAEVIRRVMRHNLREIQAEFGTGARGTIDPSRIRFNEVLSGLDTADEVAGIARDALQAAGVTPRKNAALGIELVVSLPAGTEIDTRAYFLDAMRWAQRFFAVPLLSAVIHADEDYPHAHIVMLPLRDGKLIASELLGDRKTTKAMQADFHEQVGKRYGLRLPRPQKRHSAAERHAAMQHAFDVLDTNSGLDATVLRALLEPHSKNPEPLLLALGLTMPPPKLSGSFVETMTRPCAPERSNRTFGKRLIGHSGSDGPSANEPEKQNPYALIGLSISAPPFPPPAEPQTSASTSPPALSTTTANTCATTASEADTEPPQADQPAADDDDAEPADRFTRERDADYCADAWNPDTGEFVAVKPMARTTHKANAAAAVRVALGSISKASRPPPRPPARRVMRC